MVNLRQRTAVTPAKSKVAKRTSSRTSNEQASSIKQYEEIRIDSDSDSEDEDEDILLEDSSEPEKAQVSSETDLLESYVSSSEGSISVDSDDASEDDKEIRRIIEKTEAETRNIPLTARQRAKLEGTGPEDIETTNSSVVTTLTDEQALKKSEKSRRRKLQRDAKIEETKRATIDRLLQKQKKTPVSTEDSSELQTEESKNEAAAVLQPGYMRFIEKSDCTLLRFPDDTTFQSAVSDMTRPPKICTDSLLCQVCQKGHSKYVHPRNGKLFCSASCYKLIK